MNPTRLFRVPVLSAAAVLLVVTTVVWSQTPATQPAGATGTWKWTTQGFGGDQETILKLKQEGDKLTGTISGIGGEESPISDGAVKGQDVTFKVVRDFGGNKFTTVYTGKLSGNSFKGKSEIIIAQDFDAKRTP